MSGNLRFGLIFQAQDRVTATLKRIQGGMAGVHGVASRLGAAAERVSKSLTGNAALLGEGFSLKGAADGVEYFRQLAVNANMSIKAVTRLRHEIENVSIKSTVKTGDLLDVFKGYRGWGGTVGGFEKYAKVSAAALQLAQSDAMVTGQHFDPADLGESMAALSRRMGLHGSKQMLQALAMMRAAMLPIGGGYENLLGSFREFATQSAYIGQTGLKGVRGIDLLYGTLAAGGRAREARSETAQFLEMLGSQRGRQEIESASGMALKIGAKGQVSTPMVDIVRALVSNLARNPGAAATNFSDLAKMFQIPIQQMRKHGTSSALERLAKSGSNTVAFMKSADRAGRGLAGSMAVLEDTLSKFSDRAFSGPIMLLAKALAAIPGPVATAVVALAGLAAVGHALTWVHGGIKAFRELKVALFGAAEAEEAFDVAADANPIGLIIAGVLALGAAVYELVKHWKAVTRAVRQAFEWMGRVTHLKDMMHHAGKAAAAAPAAAAAGVLKHGKLSPIAAHAMKYFEFKGWTTAQSAGIVANLMRESSLNAHAVGDGGNAYGLAQWHPSRQRDFAKWAGHSIRKSTLDQQLAFFNYELRHGKEQHAGRLLAAAKSAAQSGGVVSTFDERPANTGPEAATRAAISNSLYAAATRTGHPVAEVHVKLDGLPKGAVVKTKSSAMANVHVHRGLSMASG
jgi:hypothetical protein